MKMRTITGPGIRDGFAVADPCPYVACLDCGHDLEGQAEQRRGLHRRCESGYIKHSSVHPGNTKESDREAAETFVRWLHEPSSWETQEQADARCVALGV